MRRYQLIVFDWDGTLMDSTAHIVNCMQTAISTMALPPLENNEIKQIIGLGLNEAAQALYPGIDSKTINILAETYRKSWLDDPQEIPLFDNAHQLIQQLSEQNYLLGVATGKSRKGLDNALAKTMLGPFFHASRCVDECFSKPHPQMIEQLIEQLGVASKDTLMIGDTEFDLQMADNAGADSLAVSHGAHSVKALQAYQPQAIMADLHQVQQWLKSNG